MLIFLKVLLPFTHSLTHVLASFDSCVLPADPMPGCQFWELSWTRPLPSWAFHSLKLFQHYLTGHTLEPSPSQRAAHTTPYFFISTFKLKENTGQF